MNNDTNVSRPNGWVVIISLIVIILVVAAFIFGPRLIGSLTADVPEQEVALEDQFDFEPVSEDEASPIVEVDEAEPTPAPTTEEVVDVEETEKVVLESYDSSNYKIFGGENPEITVSGGNMITTKSEFWLFPDGFIRLVKAENGAGASWSNVFTIACTEGTDFYWPHPWELRLENGVCELTIKPDNTEGGYEASDIHGLGLAFWVSGWNSEVGVQCPGNDEVENYSLSSGSAGIDFPLESSELTLTLDATDGIIYLPLGEKVPSGDAPLFCNN